MQPWLALAQRKCKRPECRARPGGPPEESITHYVKHCPAARRLWEGVARKLRWPELTTQSWETVVSGQQPSGTVNLGMALATRKDSHGPVPCSIVRSTNLYVLLAIGLHKEKVLRLTGGQQASARPWADFVLSRLGNSTIWGCTEEPKESTGRKGKELAGKKWQSCWAWLGVFLTPIT